MDQPRIAVVGAGIGGLTLTIALSQRGVAVDLFEQAAVLDEIGAGISLTANSIRLFQRLGLLEGLAREGTEPSEIIYRRGQDGQELARVPLSLNATYQRAFGAPYIAVHRKHLQEQLVAAAGRDRIKLGHRLVGLSSAPDGTELHWEDGTITTADIVVAADGARSVVRQWMTGRDDAVYSGTSAFRGVVASDSLMTLDRPDAVQFWFGPGRHLIHFPIAPDAKYICFLADVDGPPEWGDDSWRNPCVPGEAITAFEGWHSALTEMISLASPQERWALFAIRPLERWSKGPVVLLGDAAHGMLPHHGQGANQTVEDAIVLAELLTRESGETLEQRFDLYESLRKPRTSRVQQLSWDTGYLLHLPDGPQAEQRNATLEDFYQIAGWIHAFDVNADFHGAVA